MLPEDRENHDVDCENVIEFLRNEKEACVTFSQGRFISKIKELAEKYPSDCKIIAENPTGSITAHVPVRWLKITAPPRYTKDQRERMAQRLSEARERQAKNR